MADWHPTVAEVVFAILLVVLPWGFQKEVPVVWRLVLWAVAWAIGMHLAFSQVHFLIHRPLPVKLLLAVGATCFLVALLWEWTERTLVEEQASTTTGELHAKQGSINKPRYPKFRIGIGRGNSFEWTGTAGSPITFFRDDDSLNIAIGENEFEVTTLVRDRQGNKVVEINHNRWEVYPQFSADKNYTSDTLEVQDSRGIVVLHARITQEMVEIEGEWSSEFWKGRRAKAGADGGTAFYIWQNQDKAEEYAPYILEPIFKYPSRKFWGDYK